MRAAELLEMRIGLVLTGGGARGAYQAGALLAIAEVTRAHELPFPVVAGSSAGSINAVYLATHAEDFREATRGLGDLWTTLEPRRVFRTDVPSLTKTAAAWAADLGLGGLIGGGRGKALLETDPLHDLLCHHVDAKALARNIERGRVHGIGVTATNYDTGLAVTFFQGSPDLTPWNRVTRGGVRANLEVAHVLASSAIPLFFPAVCIGGEWYADGSIRLSTPLSPAIHMGAERIVAIAVRPDAPVRGDGAPSAQNHYPTPAEAGAVMLDALFLDALESDVERTLRINQTLRFLSADAIARQVVPLRTVELLVLRPSRDPCELVLRAVERFPAALRYLFRGLGATSDNGWDLLSYLAFDGEYTTRLFELGYEDTLARAPEIAAFLG
ncbi:patatin-like phospholipase family protein [soil metagenome]